MPSRHEGGRYRTWSVVGGGRGGSTPRLRGTAWLPSRRSLSSRFIPAPAGNGPLDLAADATGPVHPRACGERLGNTIFLTPFTVHPRACGERLPQASRPRREAPVRSPRLRGTADVADPGEAGAVHPRACGERAAQATLATSDFGSSPRLRGTVSPPTPLDLLTGSSPRLRGTDRIGLRPRQQPRFIPAPAGNGTPHRPSGPSATVHPRACGERGLSVILPGCPNRFIPAPAGNGRRDARAIAAITVHPRACGERRSSAGSRTGRPPVHPRACGERIRGIGRGTPERFIPAPAGTGFERMVRVGKLRFIPAPAGNGGNPDDTGCARVGSSPRLRGTARSAPSPRPRGPVHPRACGERLFTEAVAPARRGSSPRLRGTGCNPRRQKASLAVHPRACGERSRDLRRMQAEDRFIPAPAGNG